SVAAVTPRRRSRSGRPLRTGGTLSKLYAGGGEVVAHSSVLACHGSADARRPPLTLIATLIRKSRMADAIMKAPMVAIRFQGAQSTRLAFMNASEIGRAHV